MDTCTVEGCHKPARTRGWCSAHYEYWRRTGDPGPSGDRRARDPKYCAECGNRANSLSSIDKRSLCGKHKARETAHGDAQVVIRANYGSGLSPAPNGYMRRWCPGHPTAQSFGYALEHRYVAWEAGILTDLDNHVHHVNGDKMDNRPENLEQMTAAEHATRHVHEAGFITNQHGTWPLRH